MLGERRWLVLVDLVGGLAVLGSYAHGILTHDKPGEALFGSVPASLQPLYRASMLAATAGFLMFSWFLLWRVSPSTVRIGGRFGYGAYVAIHALILFPSAIWMPLTFRYLASPGDSLWLAIRVVLLAVGAGALLLLTALCLTEPRQPRLAWGLAVAGALAFVVQTALLDALVWPALFRRS